MNLSDLLIWLVITVGVGVAVLGALQFDEGTRGLLRVTNSRSVAWALVAAGIIVAAASGTGPIGAAVAALAAAITTALRRRRHPVAS